MRILVLNAGSSSVKYGVFDIEKNVELHKGQLDRVTNVTTAMEEIPGKLTAAGFDRLDAVGHRVAHGGAAFYTAVLITDDVIKVIDTLTPLAPSHNPPALAGIHAAQKHWPDTPQVAVFDTAFHHTIPEHAYTYAVPIGWRQAGMRRYGFHGTSHKYVMLRTTEVLQKPAEQLRIISCHLGNGASVCAIERGASVDTSMGFTPLEGLVMGSRSGDVDPGLFAHLERTVGLSAGVVEHALYNDSGLKALSGVSNDMRDIEELAAKGDRAAQLAIDVYAYHVGKYIGSYATAMGGVDVIAFTGGIGENSAQMRKRICERLNFIGVKFDDDRNAAVAVRDSAVAEIHAPLSRVKILVMETQEKWMIAKETAEVIARQKTTPEAIKLSIPIAVSARHVHLTAEAIEQLFGKGYKIKILHELSQPGFFAAEETVTVIGPRSELEHVRYLGPPRPHNQIEVSRTEAFHLGVDAPLRISGDTEHTPMITLRGTAGEIRTDGIIVAKRHIHTNPTDAARMGVQHGDLVEIEVTNSPRDLVFRDVVIRVAETSVTEMHIDTDEANAAEIEHGGSGELRATSHTATITRHTRRRGNPADRHGVVTAKRAR